MRGLVANPRGDMIPRPIKSNFREGLSMLEYFIATPGARKGLVDTALRTADSGYLTRRLVDVAQELIIREEDCEHATSASGSSTSARHRRRVAAYLDTKLFGRALITDVRWPTAPCIGAGHAVVDERRSSARATTPTSTGCACAPCSRARPSSASARTVYGLSLATGKDIEIGEAVGVIAAQSIGEPGTQLTMRTFHTGGIAGQDIAGGLPRVVELFEARTPQGKAVLARSSGVVRIARGRGQGPHHHRRRRRRRRGAVLGADAPAASPCVDGQEVRAGDALVGDDKTPSDPKELLEIKGVRETQQYLVEEVQKVYRDQGVSIHDKHIELIVRQMTRRIGVQEPGDSDFLPGERVDPQGVRATPTARSSRRASARRGSARADGHHQGVPRHRLVAVGGLVPGDDPGAHRGRHRRPRRQPPRPEGEHHHRQAHPRRDGHGPATASSTPSAPDYQPMEFWSSDSPADFLASLQGDYRPEAEYADVVEIGDGGGGLTDAVSEG